MAEKNIEKALDSPPAADITIKLHTNAKGLNPPRLRYCKESKEIRMIAEDKIIIRGLCQNNLKNVLLDIPKGKIVVFTGVSGSGKSSIVFDTIAAESQRQMNEIYTAFMRGRLPKYEKPKVERIDNLSASVIVDQADWAATPAPPWVPSATCTPL